MINGIDKSQESVLTSLMADRTDAGAEAANELGQSDFLDLMLAQLRNQDPLNPMEGDQFLGQLAQFATVNGVQSIETAMEGLSSTMGSARALQASSLVGRSVLMPSDTGLLGEESELRGEVSAAPGTAGVTLEVRGSNGQLLNTLDLAVDAEGKAPYRWDGTTFDDQRVPPGLYHLSASVPADAAASSPEVRVLADVQSVTLGRGSEEVTLNLAGLGTLSLGDILEIR